MEQEILNALKRIEEKLDNPTEPPITKLNLYDIKEIMSITELGYNRILEFFKNKRKYPTFPRF